MLRHRKTLKSHTQFHYGKLTVRTGSSDEALALGNGPMRELKSEQVRESGRERETERKGERERERAKEREKEKEREKGRGMEWVERKWRHICSSCFPPASLPQPCSHPRGTGYKRKNEKMTGSILPCTWEEDW